MDYIILAAIIFLIIKIYRMSNELQNLKDAVTKEETVIAGVKTLLTTLKADLNTAIASGDMAQVQAIADKVNADADDLANAVVANTPAAPAA